MTIAHSLLQESGLPQKMIGEMITAAIWFKNRIIKARDEKILYKLIGRGRPNLSHLK